MSARMEHHTTRVPGWPDPSTQGTTLTLALRLVRMYGDRVPSAERIMRDFDVSRATAYRWRAAFAESNQQETTPSRNPTPPDPGHAQETR